MLAWLHQLSPIRLVTKPASSIADHCLFARSLERTRFFSIGCGWPYSATYGMSCESTDHLRRTGSFVSATRLPIPL